MSAPEHLHHLVSELGDSLVQAMAADDHCRDLAAQIQAKGYGLVLILEAAPTGSPLLGESHDSHPQALKPPFSEDDLRLMKSFKIRMD